jgi:O-antigen/teichoic acid export membrane protein
VLRRPPVAPDPFNPVLRLGWTAWLTNLVSGALLKQAAVALLQYAAVSVAAIGYFNLAFQSSHAAALLLVAGLGGVGMAVMSAAEAGAGRRGLGLAWRTVPKLQILLAVPLLAFTFANASSIAVILYGSRYAPVGPLMQLFLVFNVLQRLAGGGAHQAALYVLGRQRWAFLAQWLGFVATLLIGAALVRGGPFAGAPGALIAVGAGQVGAELLQLAFVWRFVGSSYPLRFAARLCAAVLLPVAVGVLWPADTLLAVHLSLGPLGIPPALVNVTASGLVFGALLLVGLFVAKPVEAGDVALLANVNPRFRPLLAPFTSSAKPQPE